MTTKYNFTKMSAQEFETWIKNTKIARTVLTIQQHHTYSPNYSMFDSSNHFEMQRGMRNYHVNQNGWSDIGQHFTIFPDGEIVTGRSLEQSPACIFGNNANAICIENVGNFDKEVMTAAQKNAIVRLTALLCMKFSLTVDTNTIVYHHWFNLSTGARNNGTKNNKSCPGTLFFGGNKVKDCETHFLPLVKASIQSIQQAADSASILKYAIVTTDTLNIRNKPDASGDKVTDREPATYGSVLRVYKEKDGWYKISGSKEHWVSSKYTEVVKRAVVTTDGLNVRNAPASSGTKVDTLSKGQVVFVSKEEGNWCRIALDARWVSKSYLDIAK